jgi:A/G-specific adenine glycosylase
MRFIPSAPGHPGADIFFGQGRFGGFVPKTADTLSSVPPETALLAWFDRNKRTLPWRFASGPTDPPADPYAVWVSEIMLQQTRVETAIPYFVRFLKRFPDLASLAAAEEAEVLALWSGLGYYRRCRALLATAREVVAAGGSLPTTARELERLPGIGPYTAAAIASIAFAEAVPVLDGNVERVLSRYAALPPEARKSSDRAALLALAADFLDRRRPGDSNQALMELGATVCTPRAPRCADCPLAPSCRALALGRPESFPAPAKHPAAEKVQQLVAFVEADDRLLLFRRSSEAGQLASMWEFPAIELGGANPPEVEFAVRFGGSWRLAERLLELRHAITTRSYAIEVRRAEFAAAADTLAERAAESGWWRRSELAGLALTGVAKKLLARTAGELPPSGSPG